MLPVGLGCRGDFFAVNCRKKTRVGSVGDGLRICPRLLCSRAVGKRFDVKQRYAAEKLEPQFEVVVANERAETGLGTAFEPIFSAEGAEG